MPFRLKVNTAIGHQCGTTPRDVASIWREKPRHQHQQLRSPPSAFHLCLGPPPVILGCCCEYNWQASSLQQTALIGSLAQSSARNVEGAGKATHDSAHLRAPCHSTMTVAARRQANMTRQSTPCCR